MAIVYFARSSNKSKQQVPYIYFGVKGKAKKVIKGYIGDEDNIPKVFFKSGVSIELHEFAPYYDIDDGGGEYLTRESVTKISRVIYSTSSYAEDSLSYRRGWGGVWADPSNKYSLFKIESSGNYLTVFKKVSEIYLNKNSENIFNNASDIDENNIKIFRFDKVVNFQNGFNNIKKIINISNLKYFRNVQNMAWSFSYCPYFIGNPVYAPNATNMCWTYTNCKNIFGSIYIGPKVTNAIHAYRLSGLNGSGLNLNNILVADKNPINLYFCFDSCKVTGNIYINTYNNTKTNTNLYGIFNKKQEKGIINVFMPSSKTLTELNTFLSSYRISLSGETHVKREDYIEILDSSGKTTNIRFYNYIPTN